MAETHELPTEPSAQVSPESTHAAVAPPPPADRHAAPPPPVAAPTAAPQQATNDAASNDHVEKAPIAAAANYYPQESNAWKWAKLTLYTLCALLSFGCLVVGAYSVANPIPGFHRYTRSIAIFAIVISLLTLICIAIEVAARFKHTGGRLNPNVSVGVWFLLFSSITSLCIVWIIYFAFDGADYLFDSSNWGSSYSSSESAAYNLNRNRVYSYYRAMFAGVILSGVLAILSFVIWVRACHEANHRNLTVLPPGVYARQGSVFASGWERYKLGLNAATFVLCVVGAGFTLGLWNLNGNNLSGMDYYFYDDLAYTSAWLSIGFFVALAWIIADFITLAVRKWKASIHPGAHVGVWLILWLAMIGIVIWTFSDGATRASYCSTNTYARNNGGYDDDGYYYDDDLTYCQATRVALSGGIAAVSFLAYATITLLFISACIDTHVRNVNKAVPVVYVPVVSQQYQPQSYQPVQLANGQKAMAVVYPAPPQPMYQQQMYQQPAYMQPVPAPQAQAQPSGSGAAQQPGQVQEFYGTAH